MASKAFCISKGISILSVSVLSVKNVVLREIIHSLVVNCFFYNFRDWPKIFTICLSTLFIQRFQLCYFTTFRKVREFDRYIANLGYRPG